MEGLQFRVNVGLSGLWVPHGWDTSSPAALTYLPISLVIGAGMADALSDKTESTINAVLGFIVVLAILGGTIALVFTNLETLVVAFQNFTSENATLAALVPIFGLVLGVLIVLGIVRLVRRTTDV